MHYDRPPVIMDCYCCCGGQCESNSEDCEAPFVQELSESVDFKIKIVEQHKTIKKTKVITVKKTITTLPPVTTLDENDDRSIEIKRRKRKSRGQMDMLVEEFALDPEWSKERLLELSMKTGLSEAQIYKWGWDQRNKKDDDETGLAVNDVIALCLNKRECKILGKRERKKKELNI